MAKLTFVSVIKREGTQGSVRCKVPAGLISAIGADEGDAIEFMVSGNTLVGAKVLTGRAVRDALKEKATAPRRTAPARVKPKASGKATGRSTVAPKLKLGKKTVKPVAKANKRRTEVEYDEAPRLKKKPVGKLLKKGRR